MIPISKGMNIDSLNRQFEQSLLTLERVAAKDLYLESGLTGAPYIEQVVIPTLERIGTGWEKGTVALSQVYMSGRICEGLVDELLPRSSPERNDQPRLAIAVFQDYHLLGKRIVYAVLRAAGYDLVDYGRMESSGLLKRIIDEKIELILLSTLMLPSALRIKSFCTELRKADSTVKVVVGGAPFRFDPHLWKEVDADAMGYSASDAVAVIKALFPGKHSERER